MALTEQASRSSSVRAQFLWDDPLLLEQQLTEEERLIRDTARQYSQEKLLPRIVAAYADEHTDREIFPEMGEVGLIGVTLPEEWLRQLELCLLRARSA